MKKHTLLLSLALSLFACGGSPGSGPNYDEQLACLPCSPTSTAGPTFCAPSYCLPVTRGDMTAYCCARLFPRGN